MRTIYDKIPDIDTLPNRKKSNFPDIQDDLFWRLYEIAKCYSMLHVTGFYNLYSCINYIRERELDGAMIDCGCFLGGSAIFMSLMAPERPLIVFDTFEGFPPGSSDSKYGKPHKARQFSDYLESVRANFEEAGASMTNVQFVKGPVEETLMQFEICRLALLRLDTDYYSSTSIELQVLYPMLVSKGVVIVDDYGCFDGCRRAVDEYFSEHDFPLLQRIDRGIRCGIKD